MTRKPKRTLSDAVIGAPISPSMSVSPVLEKPNHDITLPREHVKNDASATPHGFKRRKSRVEKPHQSVYAHPDVFRELRKIAAAEDKKPQDLYREGLREVFRRRGLDFDALDRDVED